ncbi:MAG: hypothetical protein ACJAXS_001543 [Colwellia sp.]|jgi:hypothetical protein
MRFKGKLTKWHADKAFGFIAPNDVLSQVFIHQSALANKIKIPQISDIIPISFIRWSTLYTGKMAKYKAFILITSCSNY